MHLHIGGVMLIYECVRDRETGEFILPKISESLGIRSVRIEGCSIGATAHFIYDGSIVETITYPGKFWFEKNIKGLTTNNLFYKYDSTRIAVESTDDYTGVRVFADCIVISPE